MTMISFIDIASIVVAGLALYLVYKVIAFIISVKKDKRESQKSLCSALDGYERVCNATCKLENERQTNSGVHLEEEVYIARAKYIAEKCGFFLLIKG